MGQEEGAMGRRRDSPCETGSRKRLKMSSQRAREDLGVCAQTLRSIRLSWEWVRPRPQHPAVAKASQAHLWAQRTGRPFPAA